MLFEVLASRALPFFVGGVLLGLVAFEALELRRRRFFRK